MVDQKPKIDAMVLGKFLIVFILLFIFQDGTRRSRQGTRQDCQVSSWNSWSSCSASTRFRPRSVSSSASSRGGSYPDFCESWQCYGSSIENCQLSSWSKWRACSAIRCGSSTMQTRTRHRITTKVRRMVFIDISFDI